MTPLIVDSFAGGGGASTGIEMALGRSPLQGKAGLRRCGPCARAEGLATTRSIDTSR